MPAEACDAHHFHPGHCSHGRGLCTSQPPAHPMLFLPQGKRRKNLEATRGKAGTTSASKPGRGGGSSQRAPWSTQPCPLPGFTVNSSILPRCQLFSRSYPAGLPNFLNGPDSVRPFKPKRLAIPALWTVHEPQTGDREAALTEHKNARGRARETTPPAKGEADHAAARTVSGSWGLSQEFQSLSCCSGPGATDTDHPVHAPAKPAAGG